MLLLALVFSLLLVNLGGYNWYQTLTGLPLGMHAGDWRTSGTLLYWTNHALISLFFFLIGLEIKRELLAGELQDPGKRRMLVAAAAGGMVAPASIYAALNLWLPSGVSGGWGIPVATDTALAIGLLTTLGPRLIRGAAAFLVGLAIVDDIGAILVIALVYTESLQVTALLSAAVLLTVAWLANHAGLRHALVYTILGVLLWVAMHHSGIHASIAGVLIAATVPARPRIPPLRLLQRLRRKTEMIEPKSDVLADFRNHERIESLASEARAATTPLRRWERGLDLPVALLILPLFVFLNAGVPLNPDLLVQATGDPVALGIIFGLVLGKPLGIIGAALLAKRLGFGRLPESLGFRHLAGLGFLAGIGFTMSTFIAGLALPEGRLHMAKIAILAASLVAGILGYLLLRFSRGGRT